MKRISKLLLVFVLLISAGATLISCQSRNKIRVFTTIEPIVYLTQRIGQDKVEVFNISTGTTIQNATVDFTILDQMKKGDIFFYISDLDPHFAIYEPYLKAKGIKMYDLSIYSIKTEYKQYQGESEVQGDKVSILEDYYKDAYKGFDLYHFDPFLWIDPVSAMSLADTISQLLGEYIPSQKNIFQSNFEKIKLDLANISARYYHEYPNTVKLVTLSNSFGSLQKAYNIQIFPILVTKYEQIPTAAQIELVRQAIRDNGIRFIALEPNMSPELYAIGEALVSEFNLQVITLDNLSLSDFGNEDKNFMTQLENNLSQLELIRE